MLNNRRVHSFILWRSDEGFWAATLQVSMIMNAIILPMFPLSRTCSHYFRDSNLLHNKFHTQLMAE